MKATKDEKLFIEGIGRYYEKINVVKFLKKYEQLQHFAKLNRKNTLKNSKNFDKINTELRKIKNKIVF